MSLTRALRIGLMAVLATALAFASAPTSSAFAIQHHERITRDAIPAAEVDRDAMLQILVGPPPGFGAVAVDAIQEDWRHFDNAKNPAEFCDRAITAWNVYRPAIVDGAQPIGPGGQDLVNGPAARAAFGGLLHALQDIYAHSNWVELNVAGGTPENLFPSVFPTCDPGALPPELYTGFFSLDFGIEGCPPAGPPPGFKECHSTLNKDSFDTPEGGKLLPAGVSVPGAINYYDLAAILATRASSDLYRQIRALIVATVEERNPSADGECVARNFFKDDLHEACG